MKQLRRIVQASLALWLFYLSWIFFVVSPVALVAPFLVPASVDEGSSASWVRLIVAVVGLALTVGVAFFLRWLALGFIRAKRLRMLISAVSTMSIVALLLLSDHSKSEASVAAGSYAAALVLALSACLTGWLLVYSRELNEA